MKVSTHLTLLTLLSAFGAALLMSGVVIAYFDLDEQQIEQEKIVDLLDDLDKIKDDLNRLLITGDLVFGLEHEANTYLLEPIFIQIRQLEARFQKLGKANILSQGFTENMSAKVDSLKDLFKRLLKDHEYSDIYEKYNDLSSDLVDDFQVLFRRSSDHVKSGSDSVQKKKDWLINLGLMLSFLYVMLIILLIIWGGRSISVPISKLSKFAQDSLDHSERFTLQLMKGPREIISLADILYRLINQLEGEVTKKTIDLKAENQARQETEQDLLALTARQAPLVAAWEQISEAIEILDPHGKILFVNPAYVSLFKLESVEQALNELSSLFQFDQRTDRAVTEIGDSIREYALNGSSWTKEVEVQIHDRTRIHAIHSSPVFQGGDELSQIVVIRRDITQERVAQASAAHNDRLAAIGTLAAGMAHEINNPLTYIKMSLDLIKEELQVEGDSAQELQEINQADMIEAIDDAMDGVDRVSHIVKSLLSIARSGGEKGSNEQIGPVNLLDILQACAKLMKADLTGKARIELSVRGDLMIWGRRSELIQVFLNFLINAVQAMPKDRAEEGWIRVSAQVMEQDTVEIKIKDNASGIAMDDAEKIFEPFFSSKPVGEGTGLGLSVSKGIIDAHQGTVKVDSTLGVGTTFTLTFPKLEDALPKMITQAQELALTSDKEQPAEPTKLDQETVGDNGEESLERDQPIKILIVDDDVLVAKSLAKMLKDNDVTVVNSGYDALRIIDHQAFDLILSDVMMPEIDGSILYQEVIKKQEKYTQNFIFITGAAKGTQLNEAVSKTGRTVLSKPITKRELISAVQSCLLSQLEG